MKKNIRSAKAKPVKFSFKSLAYTVLAFIIAFVAYTYAPVETAQTVGHVSPSVESPAVSSESPELYGPYEVVRVVDGDTLIVDIDGNDSRVRLIGVDTPESVHPDKSKNTEEGKLASDWTKELLTGTSVYLEYDVSPTDRYDRLLAYVYLDDGETMVNALLLENGLAQTMTIQPNSKYADWFHELQVAAREAEVGFWSVPGFGE